MAALTDQEKKKIETLRKENGIKNMYYTRYFLIRYVVAFFFFINLYWTLMLFLSGSVTIVILPILLAVFGAVCMWEQYQMYSSEQKPAVKTQFYFQTIIAVNVLLILATVFNYYNVFYPFFATNSTAKNSILVILSLGILLSVWMLKKLTRINSKSDKQYYRIQQYLASLKL